MQPWKGAEHAVALGGIAAGRARVTADRQVFIDRQIRKQLSAFRHQRDAKTDPVDGAPARDVLALQNDATTVNFDMAHDRHHRRGLACAIGPQQGEHGTRGDVEADVMGGLHRTVATTEVLKPEHGPPFRRRHRRHAPRDRTLPRAVRRHRSPARYSAPQDGGRSASLLPDCARPGSR